MYNQSETTVNNKLIIVNIISWFFGIVFFAIGVINTFWGNDPQFGVLIIFLSFIYILPVKATVKRLTGFSIPRIELIKILVGIFILWASLGVGELFNKTHLMIMDL